MSMRDEHDYLGIPDDDDEAQSAKLSQQKRSAFDRFRGLGSSSILVSWTARSSRPESLRMRRGIRLLLHRTGSSNHHESLIRPEYGMCLMSLAGASYISPFEPVLNEGDRYNFGLVQNCCRCLLFAEIGDVFVAQNKRGVLRLLICTVAGRCSRQPPKRCFFGMIGTERTFFVDTSEVDSFCVCVIFGLFFM